MKKKVRIALAIDHTGAWSCSGWGRPGKDVSDSEKMSFAIECLESGENQYMVEVDIDIPEIKTISPDAIEQVGF